MFVTQFNYTIDGILKTESVNCYSALVFNATIDRILKVADKDSIYTSTK